MTKAIEIKCALMHYFRFRRQMLCADEVSGVVRGDADILVDTTTAIYEIEVKISKSDLINGEKRKTKHGLIKNCDTNPNLKRYTPNKFYVCVPEALVEEAKKWVEATNPKYGILGYSEEYRPRWEDRIRIAKSAEDLKDGYNKKAYMRIAKRLCSSVINNMKNKITTDKMF